MSEEIKKKRENTSIGGFLCRMSKGISKKEDFRVMCILGEIAEDAYGSIIKKLSPRIADELGSALLLYGWQLSWTMSGEKSVGKAPYRPSLLGDAAEVAEAARRYLDLALEMILDGYNSEEIVFRLRMERFQNFYNTSNPQDESMSMRAEAIKLARYALALANRIVKSNPQLYMDSFPHGEINSEIARYLMLQSIVDELPEIRPPM